MLIGITNAELIRGGSQKISQFEQRIQKLEQQLRQGPVHRGQLALPGPAVPALPSSASAPKSSNKKGKGKGKKGGKNQTQAHTPVAASSSPAGFRKFNQMMKINKVKKQFIKNSDVCYKFQSCTCTANPCSRAHKCIGCNKNGVPYNDCGCAESQA